MNNVSYLGTAFQIFVVDKGHLEDLGDFTLEKKILIYTGISILKTKRANDLSGLRERIRRNTPSP